jgi:hypothetical protein
MLDRITQNLKEDAGLVDSSVGQSDPNAKSGRAIALLAQQASLSIGPTVRAFKWALSRIGEKALMLSGRNRPGEMMIPYIGQDGERDFRSLMGESLVSRTTNTGVADVAFDIEVTIEPKRDDAIIQETLKFLIESGAIDPATDKRMILRSVMDRDLSRIKRSDHAQTRADTMITTVRSLVDSVRTGELNDQAFSQLFRQEMTVEPTDDPRAMLDALTAYVNNEFENIPIGARQAIAEYAAAYRLQLQQAMAAAEKPAFGSRGQPQQGGPVNAGTA